MKFDIQQKSRIEIGLAMVFLPTFVSFCISDGIFVDVFDKLNKV